MMKILKLDMLSKSLMIALGSLALSAAPSFAIVFTTSEGIQPSNVGTITLTQVDANTVKVLLDLLPTYGLLNTGGPHTPFAFTLAGSEVGVSATFVQPNPNNLFSLNLIGGDNTPFGTYGVAIDSSAGNGSGKAYYGDLEFNLTRALGLSVKDFIANGDGYFFSADLTDGRNTGSQTWKTTGTSVPDGGSTLVLLGSALSGLGFLAGRRKMSSNA